MHPIAIVRLVDVRFDEMARARRLRIIPIRNAILHVRHPRRELRPQQLRRVQHRERQIPRPQPRLVHPLLHRPRPRQYPRVLFPGGHRHGPRQRRHVQDDVHALHGVGRVRDAIGQYQPALGVGVVDLHGLAGFHGEDVVVANGRRSDGVFHDGEYQRDFRWESESHGGKECSEESGGASHVVFHSAHAHFRFEAESAGVVDHALSTKRHVLHLLPPTIIPRNVSHDDHPRRARGRHAHPVNATVPSLPQLLPDDLPKRHNVVPLVRASTSARSRKGFRHVPAHRGVRVGIQFGRRHVAQFGGEADSLGDGRGGSMEIFGGYGVSLFVVEGDVDQRVERGFGCGIVQRESSGDGDGGGAHVLLYSIVDDVNLHRSFRCRRRRRR
mmetsp:Transcript_36281/g.76216  ORF Transcript_36281/g.76216 Transcript_36281/m.76216 type:complete len:384 (+) Transcript_36281:186-1337(+)